MTDGWVLGSEAGESPLLQAKLEIPRLPGRVLSRSHLLARLGEVERIPLALVVAPAGWGKTLLLSSWLRDQPPTEHVAWLSVDPSDVDPARFWAYVLAAVRQACDLGVDHPLVSLRRPVHATEADADVFLAHLVNGVESLAAPVTIVLDDIHHVASTGLARELAFLVQHRPRTLRLVFGGRSAPALPLARLRLAGELIELGPRDLAFALDEVSDLFEVGGVELSQADAVQLHARTEGWPAGIRLVELSAERAGDARGVGSVVGGDASLISDYLVSEVLDHMDPEIVDFLMRAAVVESLTDDLASTLTGRLDSSDLLARMAQANAFVVSQGTPPTYRFHALFRETLVRKLEREQGDESRALRRSAADWYAAHGRHVEAAEQLLAALEWSRATDSIRSAWLPLFLNGELESLTRLIDQVPHQVIAADHELRVVRAVLRQATGALSPDQDLARSDPQAIPSTPVGGSHQIAVDIYTLERAQFVGDLDGARAAASDLLAAGTGASADVKALAQLDRGITEFFYGDRSAAEACLRDGLSWARSVGRDYLTLGCLSQLLVVLLAQDKPRDALGIARDAIDLAERRGWNETLPMIAGTWMGLGWIHYCWDEFDEADDCLDRAEIAARSGEAGRHSNRMIIQAMIQSRRGDRETALSLLNAAEERLGDNLRSFVFVTYLHAERVRVLISLGRVREAYSLLTELGPAEDQPAHTRVAWAEWWVSQGEVDRALSILAPAASCEVPGFLDQLLQAQVLTAVLLRSQGRERDALDMISRAVAKGAAQGYRVPFVEFGEPARVLLTEFQRVDVAYAVYVSDLLSRFVSASDAGGHDPMDRGPLTAREVDVLRLWGDMMTAPEIAAELYLSVNTVKAHLKRIYAKLDATSRRQAVARGRALGLLE